MKIYEVLEKITGKDIKEVRYICGIPYYIKFHD